MAMTAPSGGGTGERQRALEMLADLPHGCTEAVLVAHGFTVRVLADLVRGGLAVAKPESVKAGARTLWVVRVMITHTGRQALGWPT
jgi:hypothetical protein